MKNPVASTRTAPDSAMSAARRRVVSANVLGILLPGLLGLITARGGIGLA